MLTDKDIYEIQRDYRIGRGGVLAKQYGVSRQRIHQIIKEGRFIFIKQPWWERLISKIFRG